MRPIVFIPLAALVACSDSSEAPTVQLPVATSGAAFAPSTTDLGYTVTTTRVRMAIADLQLTIEGEMHQAAPNQHPGHYAGGDVTGTLPGHFVLDWNGAEHVLGTAELIVGDYQGANFTFRAADAADGLPAGDALLGHAIHVLGVATKDGTDHPFDAVIDLDAGTQLVGAVFEDVVTEASTETLVLAFLPTDPSSTATIYDGLDFATLPTTGDDRIELRPGSAAYNAFRRPLQTHDHYAIAH